MCLMGTELQRVGARIEKAVSSQLWFLVLWGMEKRSESAKWKFHAGV